MLPNYFWFTRLVCEDISYGQEKVPIPATNLVDDPPVAPTGKLSTSQHRTFSDGVCTNFVKLIIIYKLSKQSHYRCRLRPSQMTTKCQADTVGCFRYVYSNAANYTNLFFILV